MTGSIEEVFLIASFFVVLTENISVPHKKLIKISLFNKKQLKTSDRVSYAFYMSSEKNTLVILDMYDGFENVGKKAIEDLATTKGYEKIETYDVRKENKFPYLKTTKVAIITGGPGDPRDMGDWGDNFKTFTNGVFQHNSEHPEDPIALFTICHGFQVTCQNYGIGVALPREKETLADGTESQTLLGVHTQKNPWDGAACPRCLSPLTGNSLITFESRDFRICQNLGNFKDGVMPSPFPNIDFIPIAQRDEKEGCTSLTAIGSSDGNWIGTQFHPEADAAAIQERLKNVDKVKQRVIELNGQEKYEQMLENAPELTNSTNILGGFLERHLYAEKALPQQQLMIA